MKKFSYKVRTKNGEQLKDVINAESVSDAAIKLEQRGYIVLEINELQTSSSSYNSNYTNIKVEEFKIQEKKEFFNSFYHMYKAGISVVETFRSIYSNSRNLNIKNFCNLVLKKIEKGYSLRESLEKYSTQLGLAYTMLIAAGEKSGKLEDTIAGILKNIKKQEELKSNLIMAFTYPVILLIITLAVALFFKFFIMEIFKKLADFETDYNVVMLLIGAIIKIIIIFAIIIGIGIYIYKNRTLCGKIKNAISKIKLFGEILKNYYFANFFLVMSLAYDAGVPISEAHILANSQVLIPECINKLRKSANMIQNGCKLTTAMATTDLFSSYALSQVATGEETGELGKMFKTVAYDYELRFDTAIQVMKKITEPLLIIIIGIIVGIMVVKGYKAYFETINSIF